MLPQTGFNYIGFRPSLSQKLSFSQVGKKGNLVIWRKILKL